MDGFKVLKITRMMNERGRLKVFQTTSFKVGFSTQPMTAVFISRKVSKSAHAIFTMDPKQPKGHL
jgi:hypothetical protein